MGAFGEWGGRHFDPYGADGTGKPFGLEYRVWTSIRRWGVWKRLFGAIGLDKVLQNAKCRSVWTDHYRSDCNMRHRTLRTPGHVRNSRDIWRGPLESLPTPPGHSAKFSLGGCPSRDLLRRTWFPSKRSCPVHCDQLRGRRDGPRSTIP